MSGAPQVAMRSTSQIWQIFFPSQTLQVFCFSFAKPSDFLFGPSQKGTICSSVAGHGGAKRTTTFLKKSYYWPNLKDDAEEYVKTCLTCQQNRTLNKKQVGLLQPLPIPEGPWESVSMDFMVSLPPSKGFDAIMVVVDRFSKMAHFIPTKG